MLQNSQVHFKNPTQQNFQSAPDPSTTPCMKLLKNHITVQFHLYINTEKFESCVNNIQDINLTNPAWEIF